MYKCLYPEADTHSSQDTTISALGTKKLAGTIIIFVSEKRTPTKTNCICYSIYMCNNTILYSL